METYIAEEFINTYRECQTDADCSTICDEYNDTKWYACNIVSCTPKCGGESVVVKGVRYAGMCTSSFEYYDTEDLIRDKAKNIILQFVDENFFLENYKEHTIQRNRGIWYNKGLVFFDICKKDLTLKKARILTAGDINITKEEAESIAKTLELPEPYEAGLMGFTYDIITYDKAKIELQKNAWLVRDADNLMLNVPCDELGAVKIDAETGEIIGLGYKDCHLKSSGGIIKWKTPIQNIIYYYVIGFVILAIVILFVVWKKKK